MSDLKDGNLIEKSKRLVWARFNHYTAGELRLLETYLSKINPRDPNSSTVQFTLAEYAALMELPNLRAEQVKPYLKHFIESSVTIPIEPENRKRTQFTILSLFCEGTCLYNEDIQQYVISISCNPKLQDVFFNLAESRYIRYRLRYTKDMKSQYSIRLYSMLRDWLKKEIYIVSVEELREDLGATEPSYKVLRDFTRRVLEPAVNEINRLSDLKVSYTKIKKGRSVTDICFKIKLKPSKKALESQAKEIPIECDGEWYAEALDYNISPESAWKLAQLVHCKISQLHPTVPAEQLEQATRDTLQLAYKKLLPDSRQPADNPAGYLWSVLERGTAIDEFLPAIYTLNLPSITD